ncbi:hypothetical protein GHK51_27545 [Sinorhizobium meliloti]|uniref:hypothetical protein n=1 Tax=Rhizobium meliloti TaxID=382 RepID=UPI001296F8BA|nr:hypothetical protein [Sinorhizobium meliloti]MQW13948.1 hypothetical protein [Sinorhizobium meliloti]
MLIGAIGVGCVTFQGGDRAEALYASYSSALELDNRPLGGSRHDGVSFPFPHVKAQWNLQEIVNCAARDWSEANQPADPRALRHIRCSSGFK